MLVDDHASVRSADARSAPEGVAGHRSLYVADVGTGTHPHAWFSELRASPQLRELTCQDLASRP